LLFDNFRTGNNPAAVLPFGECCLDHTKPDIPSQENTPLRKPGQVLCPSPPAPAHFTGAKKSSAKNRRIRLPRLRLTPMQIRRIYRVISMICEMDFEKSKEAQRVDAGHRGKVYNQYNISRFEI
jgi:hypothetical protein